MASKITVATLAVPLIAETKEFTDGLASATRKAGRWAANIGRTIASAGLAVVTGAATIATTAIVGVGAALVKLTLDAAPLEGIGTAFESMADKVGVSLGDLRHAASGTISDFELMRQANVALTGAGEEFGQEFGRALPALLEGARAAARATGQDVGFLFESLVTGVKRSSPLLIDNTGIVLKVGEANEALAESLGITVEEMSAEQKQIALLNATVEAAGNLAGEMGMEQLTASERIAQFKAQIKNTADQIGLSLLPTLADFMQTFGAIGERILPQVVTFIETNLAPAFETVAFFVDSLTAALMAGRSPIDAFAGALKDIGLDKAADNFEDFVKTVKVGIGAVQALFKGDFQQAIDSIREIIARTFGREGADVFDEWVEKIQEGAQIVVGFFNNTVLPTFEAVKVWFQENWPIIQETAVAAMTTIWTFIQDNLIPILAGIGAAILAIVIPAIVAWATAAASAASATIAALAPVVVPILAIGAAVALLVKAWKDDWGGIRTTLTSIWETKLKPIFESLKEWLDKTIPVAIEALRVVWEEVLLPALEIVWEFIQDSIIPIFEGVAEVTEAVLGKALEAMSAIWRNVLQPALETVWGFLKDNILPIFGDVSDFVKDTLGPALEWFNTVVLAPMKATFEFLSKAASDFAGWLKEVARQISNIDLPDWMEPGSPPPLADAFTDMGNAVKDLATIELPKLNAELNASIPALATMGGMGNVISQAIDNSRSATLNINTQATAPDVIGGFETARALWA